MEAPNALDVEPDSDDDWNALLDAHGTVTPADGAAAAVAQSANATGAGRRARDKRRRRSRKSAKRSMWRGKKKSKTLTSKKVRPIQM